MNEKTLLQSDFYFTTGRCPPRVLDVGQLPSDDPKWNAWGECAKTGSSNACTYVPLKQRYEAYSKYASTILAGSQDFFDVGAALKKSDFAAVSLLLDPGEPKVRLAAATRTATRQALLLADALLISANSGTLGKEILVARFYVNEIHYATETLVAALAEDPPNTALAMEAWSLGVDSYDSYFTMVNRAIVPKVGDPFPKLKRS